MATKKAAGNAGKTVKKAPAASKAAAPGTAKKREAKVKEVKKELKKDIIAESKVIEPIESKEGKNVKKILFVSSESAPFITTGGLGEVVGSLPKNLMEQDENIDVRIVLPLYEEVAAKYKDQLEFIDTVFVDLGWRHQYCGIFSCFFCGHIKTSSVQ